MRADFSDRSIIHLNVADFAVAVERVIDCRYRDRPVIIAPEGASRATVYDMSEEAYRSGVRKGMALKRALRLCREASVLLPHADRYERAMREFLKRALPYSPLIEMGDCDGHLFVDATGTSRLFGPAQDVAWRLRREIREDLSLDPIWSLAPNKLVAKAATRLVKPLGEYIVRAGEEKEFLRPLPVTLVPCVEFRDLRKLREFNMSHVCQVQRLSLEQLEVLFDKRSRVLYEAMRGVDRSPVLPVGTRRPSIVREREFGNDSNDLAVIEGALYALVEGIGAELRGRHLAARRLTLVLDYSDGLRVCRRVAGSRATSYDHDLFDLAKIALARAWTRRVRIRHLKLGCDRLVFPPAQMDLFESSCDEEPQKRRLAETLDKIRGRMGSDAIRVGRTLAV